MAGSIIFETSSHDATSVPNSRSQLEALTPEEQCVFIERFHRLLSNHLFAEGYYKAALGLAKNTGGESLTTVYEEAVNIQDALLRGETSLAHKWFQETNYKMKKQEVSFIYFLCYHSSAFLCNRLRIRSSFSSCYFFYKVALGYKQPP